MAAMASFFDVVYLHDSVCLSCKDVKKQGRLRYSMLSALLAMVEMFHALHILCVTLLPFAVLWWNVLLHAMCAKYYAWNRSWLWLQQAAGKSICADIMQEAHAASEATMAEEGEMCPNSPHQGGSSDDAPHIADIREMSIVSLCRLGACADEDTHAEKKDVHCSTPHLERKLPRSFGVAVYPFSHGGGLHTLNRESDVAAVCQDVAYPRHLGQQVPACEATPHSSKAQAVSASCHTSKLSFLCFLEERGPQVPQSLKDCHWASFSSLLWPLAMGDICRSPLFPIPLEQSCLQINLDRDRDLLHLHQYKGSVCVDHVSINWSILREWLQILNGSCVPGFNHGKNFPNLEWGHTKASTSHTINDNNYIISSYGTTEHVKLCIAAQQSLSDLSGFGVKNSNAYVENGGSGLDSSEDIGSACCSSIKSDNECEGTYCTGTEFSTDSNDGLDNLDMLYGAQCHRDDDCCSYKCCLRVDDTGIFRVEDTQNVYGSFAHPAMDKDGSFYDCSAHCNVGYVSPLCGTDIDGICSMDYYADESGYTKFGGDVDASGAIYGDVLRVYEHGAYESPVEIHAVNSHTWWDEDAVLLDKKETEGEKIEEEWQVV